MKELFIINDYETGQPMYYFLTNNAIKCYELLSKVDGMVEKDCWQKLFVHLCKENNVIIEYFENVKEYNY